MRIDNKLEKSFGPAGSFAGLVIMLFGIFSITTIFGVVLVLLGGFIGLSRTGFQIDTDKNMFRTYSKLYGLIKLGKWQDLSDFKELTILKNRKVYTAHSRSNRTLENRIGGYIIYMIDSKNRRNIIPVRNCENFERAKADAIKLSEDLNLLFVDY